MALPAAARAVEAELERLLPTPHGDEARLHEAMRHAALGSGKRLRAFLALAGAELLGGPRDGALRVGTALECLHAYSLAHDDLPVMDDALLRRGRSACHVAFDEATAILAGDALQALAFEILTEPATHPDGTVRAELALGLARAVGAAGMCAGQTIDLEGETRALDVEAALRMERLKTGALIAFSAESGAILAGAGTEARGALSRYGQALGLAFQLRDDELDLTGDPGLAGKDLRRDAEAGKATPDARLGAEGVRKLIQDLRAEAVTCLAPWSDDARVFVELFDFAIQRET